MNDLFTLFTSRFEAAGIDAVVTGSVAAMLYGEPRLTHDIDLVVLLDDDSIEALVHAFPDEDFYCAPEEAIRVEARRVQRGHFNIIHHETGFKADVYIAGRDPLKAAVASTSRISAGSFGTRPASSICKRSKPRSKSSGSPTSGGKSTRRRADHGYCCGGVATPPLAIGIADADHVDHALVLDVQAVVRLPTGDALPAEPHVLRAVADRLELLGFADVAVVHGLAGARAREQYGRREAAELASHCAIRCHERVSAITTSRETALHC
jgi:hypothetical protein